MRSFGCSDNHRCPFCSRPFVAGNPAYGMHVRACRDAAQRKLDEEWFEKQQQKSFSNPLPATEERR